MISFLIISYKMHTLLDIIRHTAIYIIIQGKDSTFPLLSKSLAIVCGCTARFVSDLVGKSGDRFTHDTAHLFIVLIH